MPQVDNIALSETWRWTDGWVAGDGRADGWGWLDGDDGRCVVGEVIDKLPWRGYKRWDVSSVFGGNVEQEEYLCV